jgi:dihydroflavonol-4-reductase
MKQEQMELVLVTGGAGFIAAHCIIQLLEKGYRVRATLRSLSREAEVRAMVNNHTDQLSFIEADLTTDNNWKEAVSGCTYVLHVASPTPNKHYKHEDEMIIPAREGVLRVLRVARDAGVKRVVLTSAIGAVAFGHPNQKEPFDETIWTDTKNAPPYQKSKTLAEQAAWEFIRNEGNGLELTAINPVAVLGPVLGADYSHSIYLVKNLLANKIAGCPKISSGFVDVRDVADLHLRAMTNPAAKGERFIATSSEAIWLVEIARILHDNVSDKVPVKQLPSALLRVVALKDPEVKAMVPLLGRVLNVTSAKAIRMLGWQPRSVKEATLATAESLERLQLINQ